jgi:hypothetical protein
VLALVRPHRDLVLKDLLLRHQVAVLTRPTRARPRPRPPTRGQRYSGSWLAESTGWLAPS